MTFTFSDNNTFRNIAIENVNNELIVMNLNTSNNLSFHSTKTTDNKDQVDIINIKNILNKDSNNDLHICAYNGNAINPIIQINNTNSNCNITSNLNIGGNLNVTDISTFNNKIIINKVINSIGVNSFHTKKSEQQLLIGNTDQTCNSILTLECTGGDKHASGIKLVHNSIRYGGYIVATDEISSIADISPIDRSNALTNNALSIGIYKADTPTDKILMSYDNLDTLTINTDVNSHYNNIRFTKNYIENGRIGVKSATADYMYLTVGGTSATDNIRLYNTYTESNNHFRCKETLAVTGISSFNNKVTINKVINSIGVNSFHKTLEQQLLIGNTDQTCNSILTLECAGGDKHASGIKLAHHSTRHGGYIVATDEGLSTVDISPIDRSKIVTHDALSIGVYHHANPIDKILMRYSDFDTVVINTHVNSHNNNIRFTKNYIEHGRIGIHSTASNHYMYLNVDGTAADNFRLHTDKIEVNKYTNFKTHISIKKTITGFVPYNLTSNYSPICFLESGTIATSSADTNSTTNRIYGFAIDDVSGSDRVLGLLVNKISNPSTQTIVGNNWNLFGFFNPNDKSNHSFSFTASHRCVSTEQNLYNDDYIGLIVESTGIYQGITSDYGKVSIDDAVPQVKLTNKKKSKSVLGVIGQYEKNNEPSRKGMDFGYVGLFEKDLNRLYVNSIGEGGIWIINTNGNLENGDYIQSSNVPGYGEKQDSEFLANYTVAKITCDCDFNNISSVFTTRNVNEYIAVFVGCIYYSG
jgi:hypothetical protein